MTVILPACPITRPLQLVLTKMCMSSLCMGQPHELDRRTHLHALHAQTFQLSHTELAGIIETCMTGRPMKELFHDPNKGRECASFTGLPLAACLAA